MNKNHDNKFIYNVNLFCFIAIVIKYINLNMLVNINECL